MKKVIRPISLFLAVVFLMASMLSGCGGNESAVSTSTSAVSDSSIVATSTEEAFVPDTSEEVKLTYYHIGGKAPQEDEVLANLNSKLKQKINATLEVNYLSWGDAWTKGPLLFASGEEFDMIFCAPWFLFGDQGKKGAYKELNDILPKYAPEIWKNAPEQVWKQASIDGKILAIPQFEANNTQFYGITYREDLRKKYNVSEIKKVQDFEAYFAAIKANEKSMLPWAASENSYKTFFEMYLKENTNLCYSGTENDNFAYDMTEENPKVIYRPMTPQTDEWAVIAKKWADAGYWSKNALSNKTNDFDAFAAGTSSVCGTNSYRFNEGYKGIKKNVPDADAGFYMNLSKDGKTDRKPYFQNGVAINSNSRNPERTVMLVNALMYDPEIYEAGVFGIEGKTFVKDANGNYATLPDSKPESSWGFGNMYGMGISNFKMEKKDISTENADYVNKYWNAEWANPYMVDCKLTAFVFDSTTVAAEVAAIKDIEKIYMSIICYGLTKDPAATLAEYRDKLKKAGLDKLTAEYQKQVDAFIAAK